MVFRDRGGARAPSLWISGLAPPISCPSLTQGTASSRHTSLLELLYNPSPTPALFRALRLALACPAAPGLLSPLPYTPFQSHQTLPTSLSVPIHPGAPLPAPCLPPHFSLPVLMSPIHLPLSKIHPLLP